MRPLKLLFLPSIAPIVAVLIVLAGCGGGGDSDSGWEIGQPRSKPFG